MNLNKMLNPFQRKLTHHLILWSFLFTVIFVIGLPHSVAAFKRVSHGDKIDDFKLKDITGVDLALSNFSGKTVALLFWKHPCNRCELAMRTLQQLYNKYNEEKGLELISVYIPQSDEKITSEEKEEINKIITDGGYTFPVLLDEGMKIFSKIGVITLPSLAIISKDGILVDDQPGFPKLNGDKLVTRKIKLALGFPPEKKKLVKTSYKPKGQAAKHLKFGKQMLSMGFLDKAKKKLEASVAEDPNFAPPHAILAKIYEKQKKYSQATIEHNTAIALNAEDFKIHREYAFYLLRRGEMVEAQVEFELVIELAPNSGDGYFGIGLVYNSQGVEKEAETSFRKAVSIYSGEGRKSSSSSGKGDLFASMRKKRAASKVSLNPNEAQVHVELAKLLNKQKKTAEAVDELLEAVKKYRKIVDKLLESSKD